MHAAIYFLVKICYAQFFNKQQGNNMISKKDLNGVVDYVFEVTGNKYAGVHPDDIPEIWTENHIEQAIENRGFWDAAEQEYHERNCRQL